jgi:hypothetical protein
MGQTGGRHQKEHWSTLNRQEDIKQGTIKSWHMLLEPASNKMIRDS